MTHPPCTLSEAKRHFHSFTWPMLTWPAQEAMSKGEWSKRDGYPVLSSERFSLLFAWKDGQVQAFLFPEKFLKTRKGLL